MITPGKYKHFKGGIYTVLFIAEHTETGELHVVYKNPDLDTIWIRPLLMFDSQVILDDGTRVNRFEKIE